MKNPLNLLLVLVPITIVGRILHWPGTVIFVMSGLAIVPLAKWMGTATEELAARIGPGIGGLLNASFGNATELIIAAFALRAGLIDVVKASLTGSIIGNILFVLGLALFLGGLGRDKQVFNRTAASTSAAQLALAVTGLVIPAAFYYTLQTTNQQTRIDLETNVSVAVAAVLMASYLLGLVFSLRTHKHLYEGGDAEPEHRATWSVTQGALVLLAATVGIAVMSETLVSTLEEAAHVLGWSPLFMGVILIPVVGNAAEHVTAVVVATKNKMDLSLGIAIGSSTQIALFIAPLLVFLGLLMGQPMNLLLSPFELILLGLAVLIVNIISLDGESNWLEGAQLLSAYGIAAIALFFHD